MNFLQRLRIIAVLEGFSYLFLLGVAMPLKYLAGQPLAVKITGSFHGLFFILFCFALLEAKIRLRWTLFQAAKAFISGFIPFGTFVLDHHLKQIKWPEAKTTDSALEPMVKKA